MPYIRTEANTWIEVAKPLEWTHTTAQRDALTDVPANRIIYHSTLDRFERWTGSAWEPVYVNLSDVFIDGYSESFRSQEAATIVLDPRNESAVRDFVSANRTVTLPSGLAAGRIWSVTLYLEQNATQRTITWDSKIRWLDGDVPDLSSPASSVVDEFSFRTYSGGTRWMGVHVGRFPNAGSGAGGTP